jgi:serine/threonine protein phosphatase 1
MVILAIGNIHVNLRALDDLLGKVSQEIDCGGTVVFLGDYIDRGPDSKGCIQRILDFRRISKIQFVALLGNHAQWMLKNVS